MTTTATAPEQPTAAMAPTGGLVGRHHQLTGHGMRPKMMPHAAVGALVVAAGAARLAVHLTGDEAQVATWVAASAFVIAVVAATRVRGRVFDRKARRRAFAFIAVAGLWLTGVTRYGLDLGAIGVLMAFGYGLSLHWWRIHPLGRIEARTRQEYVQLWKENIGCDSGCLAGSQLTDPEPIKAGIRFALRLRPGRQHLDTVVGEMKNVRGGLFLRSHQELIVEPHPTLPEPHLLLTIVEKSPIKSSVFWPGPEAFDPTTGYVHLGPFADGEGVAKWKAYRDNRLWGGFLQGGTGAGKSRTMESIALSLAASETHPTVILYGDGQAGASSPLLMKYADVRARSYEQILAMLEGMHLVLLLRQDENAVNGWSGFTPTKDRPGVLGFIDESHKPLSKVLNPAMWARTQSLIATIAREGGKVGVNLVLASQNPTLDAFGGAGTTDAETIRSNLLDGNGLIFKGKNPNVKEVFGVDLNPKKFPDLPGYAYVVNTSPGGRTAPFRSYFLTDKMARDWPRRIVWRCLDTGAAAAWGTTYLRRNEMAQEALDQALRRIEARRAGIAVDEPTAPAPANTPAQAATPAPAGAVTTEQLEEWGTIEFPRWEDYERKIEAEVRAEKEKARKELKEGHYKVLDAIRAGNAMPKDIAVAAGYKDRQVYNHLNTLLAAGLIMREKTGNYAVVEQAA
ncbi:hypothetical protein ACIBTV_25585 [Micromonospora sp. NPDC049366]|uniref:hypothetical protein n=1 Tax=Micromonospora sp. NPDC049366 TaxID=3364271 RepID=UPI00379E8E12